MPQPLWNFHVTADRLDDGDVRVRIESASGKYHYEKVGNYPVLMLLRMLADHVEAVTREPVRMPKDTCCNGEPE